MTRVELRPEAKVNLAKASKWYEDRSAGLGRRFLDAVDVVLGKIEKNPLRYSCVYKDVRRAPTPRFPFGIFYIFDKQVVSILRVLHQARSPALWKRRE